MRAKKAKAPSSREPTIGIDLMGSDNAPHVLLSAAFDLILTLQTPAHFILLGTKPLEEECSHLLKRFPLVKDKVSFFLANDIILMEDNPLVAIRRKKNSSLCAGMRLLKEAKLDAFVSAGNTGALMASAKMYLPMLTHIERPALLALMPTRKRPLAVLDVGANISYTAEHLVQFAQMGAAYQMARGIPHPKIGLLNIGSEALKGTSEVRLAYQKMLALAEQFPEQFHFKGNIEAKEVFNGGVDVLVTDGFTGNIFLKTAEGIANLVLDRLKENIPEKDFANLESHLNDLQQHLHYAEYPGALLCGVEGIVVKCHGYSTPKAIMNGIKGALHLAQQKFIASLQDQLKQFLQ